MATTETKNRAQRRLEEREQARFEQAERDSDTLVATSTAIATATDGMGVERIVTVLPPGYEPAATDPDPREVERLANLEKKLAGEKEERLAALAGTPESGGDVAKQALEAEGSAGTPAKAEPSSEGDDKDDAKKKKLP